MKVRIAAAFALLAAITAGAAWLGTELVMAPSGSERTRLIAMYAAISSVVFVIGLSLAGLTRRSLNRRILALSIAGPLVVGAVTVFGAWSMFISTHDTEFVVILAAAPINTDTRPIKFLTLGGSFLAVIVLPAIIEARTTRGRAKLDS